MCVNKTKSNRVTCTNKVDGKLTSVKKIKLLPSNVSSLAPRLNKRRPTIVHSRRYFLESKYRGL